MSTDRCYGVLADQPEASAANNVDTPLYEETRLALASAQQDLPDNAQEDPVWPTEAQAEQAARRVRQPDKPSLTERVRIDPLTSEGEAILELYRRFMACGDPGEPASDAEIVTDLRAWFRSLGLGDESA